MELGSAFNGRRLCEKGVGLLEEQGLSSRPSALVALADGRYSVVTEGVVAVGGRHALASWCERRAETGGDDPAERAWWQEVIGALIARG